MRSTYHRRFKDVDQCDDLNEIVDITSGAIHHEAHHSDVVEIFQSDAEKWPTVHEMLRLSTGQTAALPWCQWTRQNRRQATGPMNIMRTIAPISALTRERADRQQSVIEAGMSNTQYTT